MFEPFTTIAALALFFLVSPGLGITLSLANCAVGILSLVHNWAPAAHDVQSAAYIAQFI